MRTRKRIPRDTPFDDRFWMYVDPGAPNECWEWQGSINAGGYGQMTVMCKHWPAHKASYLINIGPLDARNVCHTCDNRRCVNPAHLYLATQSQNMKDAVSRGRLPLVIEQVKRGELTKARKALQHQASLDRLRERIQRVVGPIEISDESLERFYEGDEGGAFAPGNRMHMGRQRDAFGHFI